MKNENMITLHSPMDMRLDTSYCSTPPPAMWSETSIDSNGDDDSPRYASDEVNVLKENEMRGTPGGTIQSYKEVIDSLRKDNSNLKLKLYFMDKLIAETNEKLSNPEHDHDDFLNKVLHFFTP
eukprot:1188093-Prorocentrum_minimum.AAC.3